MITWLASIRRSPPARVAALAPRTVSASSASWEATSVAAPTMSATPAASAGSTFTRARLRNDLARHVAPRAEQHAARSRRGGPSSRPAACLVDGVVERAGVEPEHRAALGVQRQRAAQRGLAGLAVDLDGVVARAGAEDDAAAGPLRGADRARAGAAGALLAPRLGAAAADHAARAWWRACPGGARPARRSRSRARAGR